MNKKELKETLDVMKVDYPADATNKVLQDLIEHHNSLPVDPDNMVSPDLGEAPDYIGRADLKSQDGPSKPVDRFPGDNLLEGGKPYPHENDFIDPNWGSK